MYIFPKLITLRKSLLFYRGLRYRKGYGVHSPFVFNLINKVIENKYPFYSFSDIELVRRELIYDVDKSTGKKIEQRAIKPKKGALLFRLANYFKSKNILQIGSSMGISTLYLTSYAQNLNCKVLENNQEYADVTKLAIEKSKRNNVEIIEGKYEDLLPKVLSEMGEVDLVYFNMENKQDIELFYDECRKYVNQNTVFVFDGIKDNKHMRSFWKNACASDDVTVSMDLYSTGLLFFNQKLHKRNYIVYF